MPAATANVEQIGAPLGNLVLSGAAQEFAFTNVNRVNTIVQIIAVDASGDPIGFIYRVSQTGTQQLAPAGAGLRLPVNIEQSYWFEEDTAAGTLQASCVG